MKGFDKRFFVCDHCFNKLLYLGVMLPFDFNHYIDTGKNIPIAGSTPGTFELWIG